MTVDHVGRGGSRMPALYLSHGAPPLADDTRWTAELASWSAQLPQPEAILVISAHWEVAPLAIGATSTVPLTGRQRVHHPQPARAGHEPAR